MERVKGLLYDTTVLIRFSAACILDLEKIISEKINKIKNIEKKFLLILNV